MRVFIFLLLVVGGISCRDVSDIASKSRELTVGKPLVEKDMMILDGVIKNFSFMNNSRATPDKEPFKSLGELTRLTVTSIPSYTFDVDRFYEDPSPERIFSCLSLAENEVWYMCRKSGTIQFMFNAIESDGKWNLSRFYTNCDKFFSWFPNKFFEMDSLGYGMFQVYNSQYAMYKVNGRLVYCDIAGNVIQESEFCQQILHKINFVKENKKRIRRSFTTSESK